MVRAPMLRSTSLALAAVLAVAPAVAPRLALAQSDEEPIADGPPKAADIQAAMTLRGDLGIDSLMGVELQVALEAQVGHPIDTAQLGRVETVAELEALVHSSARAIQPAVIEEEEEEP